MASGEEIKMVQEAFEKARRKNAACLQQAADKPPRDGGAMGEKQGIGSARQPAESSAKTDEPRQSLFDFLLESTETAHVEHQRQKAKLNNLWWYFVRQARLHERMRKSGAQEAAKYLSGFFDRCVLIVNGREQVGERAALLARQFITRLAQQGEVMNAFDMETKVLKAWEGITSTPGESKVKAAVRYMFARKYIEAMNIVPVRVSNKQRHEGRDDWQADSMDPVSNHNNMGRGAAEHRRSLEECSAALGRQIATYWDRLAQGGGAQALFEKGFSRASQQKEGIGWHCYPAEIAVSEDNPRRCFAFMLWELWQHLRADAQPAYWAEPKKMVLGSRDIADALSPFVPIADRTVGDLRRWMEGERVLQLVSQGGKQGGRMTANEYLFNPIAWVFWWSRERLAWVDKNPLDWS